MDEGTNEPKLLESPPTTPPIGYVTVSKIRDSYTWKVSASVGTNQADLFAAMEDALAIDAALRKRLGTD